MNPCPEAFVISKCMANLQSKVSGVGVDEARRYTSIASVPMYEGQVGLSHFPRLLNDLIEQAVPDDLSGVVSMKINSQVLFSIRRYATSLQRLGSSGKLAFWRRCSFPTRGFERRKYRPRYDPNESLTSILRWRYSPPVCVHQ